MSRSLFYIDLGCKVSKLLLYNFPTSITTLKVTTKSSLLRINGESNIFEIHMPGNGFSAHPQQHYLEIIENTIKIFLDF